MLQVREGRALAPGMDPEAELKTLRLRFDNFRRDFKVCHTLHSLSLSVFGPMHSRPALGKTWMLFFKCPQASFNTDHDCRRAWRPRLTTSSELRRKRRRPGQYMLRCAATLVPVLMILPLSMLALIHQPVPVQVAHA